MLHSPRRPGNVIVRPHVRNRYLLEFFHAGQWENLDVVAAPDAEQAVPHPSFWVMPADGGCNGCRVRVSLHGEKLLEGTAEVHHVPGAMRATTAVLRLDDGRMVCLWGISTPESYLSDHDKWEDQADAERLSPQERERLAQVRSFDARFAPRRAV